MISKLEVSGLRFSPGCSGVLDEKTVLLNLNWAGELDAQIDWGERWAGHLATLRSGDPLWGMTAQGCPADFIAPASEPGAPPFVVWVVALTVALQRWARQPVWQGAVVHTSANVARVCLPYHIEEVFKPALQYAVRLLLDWSKSEVPNQIGRAHV